MALFCTLAHAAVVSAMVLSATPAHAQAEQGPGTNDLPANLRVLLATEAALHGIDMFTTAYGLQLGGIEANPLLGPLSRSPTALITVSSGINLLQIYAITRLHRRHPKIAVAWAAILIGAEAFAVTNNVKAARQLQRARAGPR